MSEQKTVYVEIALYLINLHSVDLKAGTFHADFYLYFKGMYLEGTESFQVCNSSDMFILVSVLKNMSWYKKNLSIQIIVIHDLKTKLIFK